MTGALLATGAVAAGSSLLGWLAAIATTASGVVRATSGAGRTALRRVHLDGGRVTVRMRRTFPVAATLFVATMAAFLGSHAATADATSTRAAAAACCLLGVAVLPDLVRAALTRTHLTFDAHHLTVRSWSTEAGIDWDDVAQVDLDTSIPARPALRIRARPHARSLVVRRRRLLVPLEPRAPHGQIIVNTLLLDEPWLLIGQLATLVDLSAEERAPRLTADVVQVLTGHAPTSA